MREYVFQLTYDPGVHPIRDAFIRHPEVVATAIDLSITHDSGWRIERLTGPEEPLNQVQDTYFDQQCNDCSYPTADCDAELEYEVLETEPTVRIIYRHGIGVNFCSSLGYLALKYLGRGLVFDATQRGPHYEWRILVPAGRDVRGFHDSIVDELPDGVTLTVRQVGDIEGNFYDQMSSPISELSYEQRQALEFAWDEGYYDHPRGATLEDIAGGLGIPLTTLRYRLRRAEEVAVRAVIKQSNPKVTH